MKQEGNDKTNTKDKTPRPSRGTLSVSRRAGQRRCPHLIPFKCGLVSPHLVHSPPSHAQLASRILFNLSCNAPPIHLILLFSHPQDDETNHEVFLSKEGGVYDALPSSSPSTTCPIPLHLSTPSPWLEREPAAMGSCWSQ